MNLTVVMKGLGLCYIHLENKEPVVSILGSSQVISMANRLS